MRNEYKNLNYKYALPEQRPQMLKDWFRERTGGGNLDLDNPKTFNEKIQWIKLNDIDDLKTKLTDKYEVRDWVKDKIGEQYLIPLLGVYDRPEEINWDELPHEFIIKCNHGCKWNIIVKDKNTIDRSVVNNSLHRWLQTTYGINGFELQYYKIKPKIIIEKKIENEGHDDLFDYKIWCFGGRPEFIQFSLDRHHGGLKHAMFDVHWEKQPYTYHHPMTEKDIEKPSNLDEMLQIAKKLSDGFRFVRVDLYRLNDGAIYFGEMTFTPECGIGEWFGKDMGIEYGNLIKLT